MVVERYISLTRRLTVVCHSMCAPVFVLNFDLRTNCLSAVAGTPMYYLLHRVTKWLQQLQLVLGSVPQSKYTQQHDYYFVVEFKRVMMYRIVFVFVMRARERTIVITITYLFFC